MSNGALAIEVVPGVARIPEDEWQALHAVAPDESSPFMEWGFLVSLEEANTLGRKSGWLPQILCVRREGRLIAAAPAYVKLHSQGEFVFDFAFAELAGRLGIEYYPKLLAGVPFTPATGRRFLTGSGEDRPALLEALGLGLLELARTLELSSVHVNFAQPDEIAALTALGFHERHGVQFHWHRRDARTFDDYLARFNSKRRNQLRREAREPEALGIRIETLRGDDLEDDGLVDVAFELYKSTVDKFVWGRQYLNRRFFDVVRRRMRGKMELVLARRDGTPIAGAINFASARRLYGRYWGAREEVRFLHFNVCYYHGIRECLARGLEVFEPGAGGEHKLARGFEPTVQRSAHWFADRRLREPIAAFLSRERDAIAGGCSEEED